MRLIDADVLIEWLRKRFSDRNLLCLHCPISKECFDFAYEPLCDEEYAEEFKQAIIDSFSPFRVKDGDRVEIYEGLKLSRRTLDD